MYGFKDQIVYPSGTSQGLVIFPPVVKEKLAKSTLFFIVPGDQVVTFSFTLTSSD